MKHILPKWKLAKIVQINGMTSLLCVDLYTNQVVSRHLQDCAPVKLSGNYGNLFQDSLTGGSHEIEEDFGGMEPEKIPNLDGCAVDAEVEKSRNKKDEGTEQKNRWEGRLRKRQDAKK